MFAVILVLGLYGGTFLVLARKLAKRVAVARYFNPSQTSEPSILYLRGFEHERRPFIFRSGQPRQTILEFYWSSIPAWLTFEQYFSHALESELAPLVALGHPDGCPPAPGALRDYVEDQVWQDRFEDLAVRSKAIFLLPSESESLNWELGFPLSKGLASKLFIIFGPLTFSRPRTDPEWLQKLTGYVLYEPLNWSRFASAIRAAGYNLAARAPVLQYPSLRSTEKGIATNWLVPSKGLTNTFEPSNYG